MRTALVIVVAGLLGGCASTTTVSTALSGMNNLAYGTDSYGNQYVTHAHYVFDGVPPRGDSLPLCVAQNVQNKSVTLADSSGSFLGASGTYYQIDKAREAGGGSVIKYVSDDRQSVLAQGSAGYQFLMPLGPIDESVRFDLKAQAMPDRLVLGFSNLERAQLATGVVET